MFFSSFFKKTEEKKGLKIQSKSYYYPGSKNYTIYITLTNKLDNPVVISPKSINNPILPVNKTSKCAYILVNSIVPSVWLFSQVSSEYRTKAAFGEMLMCEVFMGAISFYRFKQDQKQ